MRRHFCAAFVIVVATSAAACGEASPAGEPSVYVTTIAPLLADRCASKCHEPGVMDSGFMDLRSGNARASLVSVASKELPTMLRVAPGNPQASYLWHKLMATQLDVGGCCEPMPYASTLKAEQLEAIEQWILDGAKE